MRRSESQLPTVEVLAKLPEILQRLLQICTPETAALLQVRIRHSAATRPTPGTADVQKVKTTL
jgi:hypothetical protein